MPKSVIFRAVSFDQNDVRRLHIAMDDAFRVREVERVGDLRDDVADLVEAERPACARISFRLLPSTYSIAMNDVPLWLVPDDVMDGDDGRMIQNSSGLRFADETLLELFCIVVVAGRIGWFSARPAFR